MPAPPQPQPSAPGHRESHSHKRTQSLLLISKLLSARDAASPFTLIVDSLAQSATPLLRAMLARARAGGARTVFVAFEALAPVGGVDVFVGAAGMGLEGVRARVGEAVRGERGGSSSSSTTTSGSSGSSSNMVTRRTVVVVDSLAGVLAGLTETANVASYLSSLLVSPGVSLVAVVHADVPLVGSAVAAAAEYAPAPLALLRYLATSVLTTHSLAQVLARKAARDRSVVEPVFGLDGEADEKEGVLMGLGSNDVRGLVLEMEHRRKSGRSVGAWYFLPSDAAASARGSQKTDDVGEGVMLLDDHPLYRTSAPKDESEIAADSSRGLDVSFNLGLTEKQRADRESVVLPYYDAQRDGGAAGPGEGGRILYDMGSEDDFDEEEDEI